MAAETAKAFAALERQAQVLMSAFIAAGHEAVSPAVIQPARYFLDVIGEGLRARTYVFTDPDGDELCLRPDLTVPTCRLHLERDAGAQQPAKYCYNGAAFRFQPQGSDSTHPREFRQAGIENFGDTEREAADAETVALILSALRAAGLQGSQLRIGDLGLFRALLKSVAMPERWRQLLMHRFWRPDAFRAELKRLVSGTGQALDPKRRDFVATLDETDREAAQAQVAAYLDDQGIELTGSRSLAEITESLLWVAADAKAAPLSPETAAMIERYVTVGGPALRVTEDLRTLAKAAGPDMTRAVDTFAERLKLLSATGVDLKTAEFSAEFGRNLEYYTGFVFEVVLPKLGRASPVAGGGRYDRLLKAVGAPRDIAAVGAAVHTERLLAAINGGSGAADNGGRA
ncbi:MAG: ATP phosphoribosyltransferase regulatory subunit [Hyphomicrobiaceae bacterium]|nr:ATP phosphoribosyltransferase regulatory subunit [Hyphomicrobiaceae bacterium]